MNRQQAVEALLAGKKITYKSFTDNLVVYLKDNKIIYEDTSSSSLEQWLRLPYNHTFYEYVEKPKFPRLKDVPFGSVVRMVDSDGPYGSKYLKISQGIVSENFCLQNGSHDNDLVKVVGEVKW